MADICKLKTTVKQDILSCLISSKNKLTTTQLMRDYKKLVGSVIPYKTLGYSNIEHLLGDIPDIVRIEYSFNHEMLLSGISTNATEHIDKLVNMQKDESARHKRNLSSNRRNFSRPPPRVQLVPHHLQLKIKDLLDKSPDVGIPLDFFHIAFAKLHGTQLNWNYLGFDSMEKCLDSIPCIVFLERSGSEIRAKRAYDVTKFEEETMDEEPLINSNVRKSIQKVLQSCPQGIWIYDFQQKFQEICSKPLDLKSIGYNNITEFVEVFPKLFAVKKVSTKYSTEQFLLFDAETYNENNVPDNQEAIDSLVSKIFAIVNAYPNELKEDDLESMYNINFKEKDPWLKLGYSSLTEFLLIPALSGLRLRESGACASVRQVNDSILNQSLSPELPQESLTPSPKATLNPLSRIAALKEEALKMKPIEVEIPHDVVLPGVEYEAQWFTEDFDLNSFFKVYVSQVDSPSSIWIQLIGEKYCLALDSLMEKLNKYYAGVNGDKYLMPKSYVMESIVCAAIFPVDHRWHRAKIIGIPSDDTVQVQFVDYGTESLVSQKNIRFLKMNFLELPAQAIRACLSGIKPVDFHWSALSQRIILQYSDSPLYIKILNLNVDGKVSLDLCYTDENSELHINDFLVSQGEARPEGEDSSEEGCGNTPEMDDRHTIVTKKQPSSQSQVETPTAQAATPRLASDSNNSEKSDASSSPYYHRMRNYGPPDPLVLQRFLSSRMQHRVIGSETVNQQALSPQDKELTASAASNPPNQSPEIYLSDEEDFSNIKKHQPQTKFCKKVTFTTEHQGHIINYKGKPYLTGPELSSYIFGLDIITQMFFCKQITVELIVVVRTECPKLFKELEKLRATGFTVVDNPKDEIQLYPLSSCLEALAKVQHPSSTLKKAITREMESFNPNESHWSEVDREELRAVFVSEIPSMKEKLTALQIEKKKTLEDMIKYADADKETTKKMIRQLNSVQQDIFILEENIFDAKENGVDDRGPVERKPVEEKSEKPTALVASSANNTQHRNQNTANQTGIFPMYNPVPPPHPFLVPPQISGHNPYAQLPLMNQLFGPQHGPTLPNPFQQNFGYFPNIQNFSHLNRFR